MNKFVKKAALMIPPLQRLYMDRERLQRENLQLINERGGGAYVDGEETFEQIARILEMRAATPDEFATCQKVISAASKNITNALINKCLSNGKRTCTTPGFCEICGRSREFYLDLVTWPQYSPFREGMSCPTCGLNSRMRYMAATIISEYQQGQKLYLYEQVTPLYKVIKERIGQQNVTGSEYLSENLAGGTINSDGIRHENAENLSFNSESFDYLMSCDVFEHVNNYMRAFSEAFRVLKHGGKLYMSVPFNPAEQHNFRRAEIVDGKIIYYAEPVVHGNPLSNKGSLCFWDYGWDMLTDLKAAGFDDVYLRFYSSLQCGYLDSQFVFIAVKD